MPTRKPKERADGSRPGRFDCDWHLWSEADSTCRVWYCVKCGERKEVAAEAKKTRAA